MSVETYFIPNRGDETHVYSSTERGGSTAILDFLNLAFIAYCDEEERGAKVYVLPKKIIRVKGPVIYFPRSLDLSQHIAADVAIAGSYHKPVFHRKAGLGILTFEHNHPDIHPN